MGAKRTVPRAEVTHRVTNLLPTIQDDLLATATRRRDERTAEVTSVEDAVEAGRTGFARIAWDLIKDGGEEILARDAITVRVLQTADGGLPTSEDDPDLVAYIARSY